MGYITEVTGVMPELIEWLSIKYDFKLVLRLEKHLTLCKYNI